MKFTSSLLVVLFLCTDLCAQDTTIKESISLIPITIKSRKKTQKEKKIQYYTIGHVKRRFL